MENVDWTSELQRSLDEAYHWTMMYASEIRSSKRLTSPGNINVDGWRNQDNPYKNPPNFVNIVDELISKRRGALKIAGIETPLEYNPAHGRLLLAEPYSTIFDGSGSAASYNFIGHEDLPPTDTWVGAIPFEQQYRERDGREHTKTEHMILSFVPIPEVENVQCAMDCNPMDGLHWYEKS